MPFIWPSAIFPTLIGRIDRRLPLTWNEGSSNRHRIAVRQRSLVTRPNFPKDGDLLCAIAVNQSAGNFLWLFRQEPQPPVKGKNLDDGCHASRLREHALVGPPVPRPVFGWRGEDIRYTGFFSLVSRQFNSVRVLAPSSTFERNKNCFGRSLNLPKCLRQAQLAITRSDPCELRLPDLRAHSFCETPRPIPEPLPWNRQSTFQREPS